MPLASAPETLPGVSWKAFARSRSPRREAGPAAVRGAVTAVGPVPARATVWARARAAATGGGVYRPGSAGLTIPRLLRDVTPKYTAEAMRARIQGTVWLDVVVLPTGEVGDVKVSKSLDQVFGLDEEAIAAARQWRFAPGLRFGEPVAVLVTLELFFNLR